MEMPSVRYSLVPAGKVSRVYFDGEEYVPTVALQQLFYHVLTNKQRRRGQLDVIQREMRLERPYPEKRRASFTWHFTYKKGLRQRSHHSAKVRALEVFPGYWRVTCLGTKPEWVVNRANEGPERFRRWLEQKKLKPKKERAAAKKKRKGKKAYEAKKRRTEEKRAAFIPAPISKTHTKTLSRQFRKSKVSWRDMMSAIIEIFDVKRDWKRTAEQRVSREIMASLKQSGHRFVEYGRRGFKIRCDLVDGIWRGDITPLTVSCTKDKTHPLYRKTRDVFKEKLLAQRSARVRTPIRQTRLEERLTA